MWGCGDVGMWGCGDEGMWGCGDVGMWGCGDVAVGLLLPCNWGCEYVNSHGDADGDGLRMGMGFMMRMEMTWEWVGMGMGMGIGMGLAVQMADGDYRCVAMEDGAGEANGVADEDRDGWGTQSPLPPHTCIPHAPPPPQRIRTHRHSTRHTTQTTTTTSTATTHTCSTSANCQTHPVATHTQHVHTAGHQVARWWRSLGYTSVWELVKSMPDIARPDDPEDSDPLLRLPLALQPQPEQELEVPRPPDGVRAAEEPTLSPFYVPPYAVTSDMRVRPEFIQLRQIVQKHIIFWPNGIQADQFQVKSGMNRKKGGKIFMNKLKVRPPVQSCAAPHRHIPCTPVHTAASCWSSRVFHIRGDGGQCPPPPVNWGGVLGQGLNG